MNPDQQNLIVELGTNRRLAHHTLFAHRHSLPSPDFHYDMIDLWNGPHPKVVTEAFRDGGKSTIMEETAVLGGLFQDFRNCVVIGASYDRACERLLAIKNEYESNPYIEQLFGDMVGSQWGEGKIILTNGICFQAFGCGMSLRGSKHLEARPDFCFIDDLEDEDSVRTPDARYKMLQWLYRTMIPALAKDARIRFTGNQLDAEAVIAQVSKDPNWTHQKFPVMHQTQNGVEHPSLPTGTWEATWPQLYDIDWIVNSRDEYARRGLLAEWGSEYMCEADTPEAKIFRADMIRVEPLIHVWQATYAAYDPARTVKATSATTGKAVFSWVGHRLIVWEGGGFMWSPQELVDDLFITDDRYRPVAIGIEETGLEEFIRQPVRQAQVRRAQPLPVRALKPPRDKRSFIRSLQPYFVGRDVVFAGEVSDTAKAQLLGFPTGRIDFPNALAYALLMRPGRPVFEGFGQEHIVEELPIIKQEPVWLLVNATSGYTVGAVVQLTGGYLHVLCDWFREGGPGEVLADIVAGAGLETGRGVRLAAPHRHFADYDTVGLRPAAAKLPADLRALGDMTVGREELRSLLSRRKADLPLVRVAQKARWTMNALAGGYCYGIGKGGQLSVEPTEGPYRSLMEAIEGFCALMRSGVFSDNSDANWQTTADGRRFMSALVKARG